MTTAEQNTISVQWEFFGRASQEDFRAAQAVASAMECFRVDQVTKAVLDRACETLGDGWDRQSVEAAIEGCEFELIGE